MGIIQYLKIRDNIENMDFPRGLFKILYFTDHKY